MVNRVFGDDPEKMISEAIDAIRIALTEGIEPERLYSGSFETYLLRDRLKNPRAIFKPESKLKSEHIKEYAAYVLDYENFAGVPPTQIAQFSHPAIGGERKGSCQLFCPGKSLITENIENFDPESVRRIAILDIRIGNLDRNIGNFLSLEKRLIPIDHNLSLPSFFSGCYFAWADWKEAKLPFSEEEKRYIAHLDALQDRQKLLDMGVKLASANLCYFLTLALQEGVLLGLTAFQFSFFLERRRSKKTEGAFPWALPDFTEALKATDYRSETDCLQKKESFQSKVRELVAKMLS